MEARYVMLGDVVGSREIDDRAAFRERFEIARAAVERAYRSDLYAGPTVLKGIDEFGAVLTSIAGVYDIAVSLHDHLHPNSIRLAVAKGSIEFGANENDIARMDGEAFHRSTELLSSVEATDLRFDLETGRAPLDTAVADEINLLLHLRESWTDRQREVISRYEGADNQQEVADALGVSQQAVSNILQGASWPLVETIEERLRRTLERYDE